MYDEEEVKYWKMLLGYDNQEGNIRILYNVGLKYYLYISEEDKMELIKSSYHLAVFYRLIDDIRHVAYITRDILDYLTRNSFLMNHYPMKSSELMIKMFDYIAVIGTEQLLKEGKTE